MLQYSMLKTKAIQLLGGTIASAAEAVGVSYQAVNQWPDELPERIADRVLAAQARKHLSPELIGEDASPPTFTRANGEVVTDQRKPEPVKPTDGLNLQSPQHPAKFVAKGV